jgi:hypothetical protein
VKALNTPETTLLRAKVSNGGLKSDNLPGRIKVLNWGDNPSTQGTFSVGRKTLDVLPANQRQFGFERVALDWNHCTESAAPAHKELLASGQPPIVFGYGRPAVVEGDGIWLEDMEWTPDGQRSARNFEDLSPAVAAGEDGQVYFLSSVALVTNGSLHDVTFFSAQRREDEPKGLARCIAALERENAAQAATLLAANSPAGTIAPLGGNIRGLARYVAAQERGSVVRGIRSEARTGASRGDPYSGAAKRRMLMFFAARPKQPVNPATSRPFTTVELGALPLEQLRILYAQPVRGGLSNVPLA